jgi:hypothetical protein
MRRTHRALALSTAAVLLTVATGCGDDSGGDDGAGGYGGTAPDALRLVPAGATSVEVVERAAAAERIGADAETGDPADDIADYAQQMAEKAPWGGTELDQWVVPMNEGDAAFTALDVERQVTFSSGGGALVKVWQVGEGVDLAALATDLEKSGFEAEEADGATTFTADLGLADPTTQLVDGKYPVVSFREVTVVPDEHLVVAGPADAVLAVVSGDDESLADTGGPDGVIGSLGDAEFLSLTSGDAVLCAPAQAPPDALEDSGLDALETPEQVAFAITGEGSVAASVTDTFAFPDPETAEADAEARQAYLDEGTSMKTREPIAGLLDGVEVSTSGSVETVEYTFSDGAGRALLMHRSQDVVSACNPG